MFLLSGENRFLWRKKNYHGIIINLFLAQDSYSLIIIFDKQIKKFVVKNYSRAAKSLVCAQDSVIHSLLS